MQKNSEALAAFLRGKMVAFIGAGVSHKTLIGQFCAMGAQVTLCDKKQLEDFGDYAETLKQLGVRLSLGEHYLDGLAGQQVIMRTPGFEYYTPALQAAKAAGSVVTSEMELFFDYCPCHITAVTGSDGKTTTTSLIAAMLTAAGKTVHLGGNIGRALLPILAEIQPDDEAVVELSSFQLISMRKSPNVAVVTNVTPNHLDHHKDMQEYVDAKRNILLWQTGADKAVLGYENDITRAMAADCKGSQCWFTRLRETDNGAFLRADGMLCMAENGTVTPVVSKDEVKLRGLHNIENLLAAIAAVWGRVPVSAMADTARTFTGVEHRIEPVRMLDGVQWYNDSIASSPSRTIAGLRSFHQKVILIAGGYDKHIPFDVLGPEVTAHVKELFLTGDTAQKIKSAVEAAPDYSPQALPITVIDDFSEAVLAAHRAAKPGDVVILSPACASFDKFKNFMERGAAFKKIIYELA